MLPLVYLNTHVHELGHAVTAIITGGSVQYILVNADGSGLAPVSGGFLPLIAAAGYVGSSVVGGALIAAGARIGSAQKALQLFTALLAISMVFFVRGDWVGVLSGVAWLVALAALSSSKHEGWVRGAVTFLGIQLALTSLQAFAVLWGANVLNAHSDAEIMERTTGLPAVVWSLFWLALSLVAIWRGWSYASRSASS